MTQLDLLEAAEAELTHVQRGQAYLEELTQETRRDQGVVYTPLHLVGLVLDLAQYSDASPLHAHRLLDPACGAGAFLAEAVVRLAASLQAGGVELASRAGGAAFLEAVERCLFGVDIDPFARSMTIDAVRGAVSSEIRQPIPEGFFDANVIETDFLDADDLSRWSASFDFVVGNPPYVSNTRIPVAARERLRSTFESAVGRLDLYTLFMERGLELLRPGGRLAFITPNKFLANLTSRPLRRLILRESVVHCVANFRSHKVFEDAATVPCVTVLEKAGADRTVRFLECSVAPRAPMVVIQSEWDHPQPPKDGAPWRFLSPETSDLVRRLRSDHPRLGSQARRISAGIATGRDGIFVLPRDEAAYIETAVRHPAVRGRDLGPSRLSDPGLDILVPYLPDSYGRPRLVDLDEYPGLRSYLEPHRRDLEARHCVRKWGKAWYDLHDPWSEDVTGATKILVPDVADHNRFVLDRGRFCPLHSAYFIVPTEVDPDFLTALLNSTPFEFLVRVTAPTVKDGFSRYRKQFLEDLPVPAAPPEALEKVVSLSGASRGALDLAVTRLLGLDERDLQAMRRVLDELRDGT